ncbi:hypothetical protein DBR40_24695 [Pedobacter sp. KBW01]|uniref:hypothetical protein n=1 Tax=Pedobacter sp. KBW01 TaxID=2153364 RepID=UPI000F597C83|nr:hypothetical protein [Pedobacter sp. KBW01]RQO65075.1 hypothetical protein DBR40_24695 [Pedobacter sp. KBW01]
MNTISIAGQSFKAPSSWEELTYKQLLMWVKIISKDITLDEAFSVAVVVFYGIPKKLFFSLNPVQKFELKETLTFLYGENKLVTWLVPFFQIRFRKYTGPENRLSNSTIKEFRHTEMYYNAYNRNKNPKFLDLLIATLYRPKAKVLQGNDLREPFSEIRIRSKASSMRNLSNPLRSAILFNYEGCRNFIFKKYPMIFKPGAKKSDAIPDMEDLIKTVAGAKFGNFNETETTGIYLFLDDLKDKIEEYERNQK